MLLDRELADLSDAGVIDLDFVGRMRSRRERGAKCEERNAEPRFPRLPRRHRLRRADQNADAKHDDAAEHDLEHRLQERRI
ncbi:MAG TPA: hypothetical protein VHU22_01760, partial [Xanthobacteraceae bacterium]|nr:hypothetical protein [Xanthobacteraceae bacterium]